MSNPSPAEVRAFLLHRVSGPLSALGLTPDGIRDGFDLLAEGVIDSLGLVQMIVAVESRFQVELDLEELEVEDLGVVGPFSRYVAERAVPVAEGGRGE